MLIWTGCDKHSGDSLKPELNGSSDGQQLIDPELDPSADMTPAPHKNTPIELTFLDMAQMTEAVFQESILKPIQSKYPAMEIRYELYPEGADIKSYFSSHRIPDIIYAPLEEMDMLVAQKLLGKIPQKFFPIQSTVESMKKIGNPDGTPVAYGAEAIGPIPDFYGMLKKYENGALYYNIDLFDRFGVNYPWEGMTWSETFDLAKKLTREEGGVFYQGFQSDYEYLMDHRSLKFPYYDSVAKQSNLGKDEWTKWLFYLKSFYDLMGNELQDEPIAKTRTRFIQDQTIAMWAGNYIYPRIPKSVLNWDKVSIPIFQSVEGEQGKEWNATFFGIGNTEWYEEEAATVIASLFENPGKAGGGLEIKQEYKKVLMGLLDVNSAIRQAEELAEFSRK